MTLGIDVITCIGFGLAIISAGDLAYSLYTGEKNKKTLQEIKKAVETNTGAVRINTGATTDLILQCLGFGIAICSGVGLGWTIYFGITTRSENRRDTDEQTKTLTALSEAMGDLAGRITNLEAKGQSEARPQRHWILQPMRLCWSYHPCLLLMHARGTSLDPNITHSAILFLILCSIL